MNRHTCPPLCNTEPNHESDHTMTDTPGKTLDQHLAALDTRIAHLEGLPDSTSWEDQIEQTLADVNATLAATVADVAVLRDKIAALTGAPADDDGPGPEPDDPPPVEPDPVLPVSEAQFTVVSARNMSQNATGRAETQWMQPNFNWPTNGNMTPYIGGDAYMRLDVKQKPSDLLVAAQFCLWHQTDGTTFGSYEETCSPWRACMFTEPGVYWVRWRPPASWYQAPQGARVPTGVFPWSQRPHVARLFIKPVLNKSTGQPAAPGDTDIDGSLLLANRNAGASSWQVSDAEIGKHLPIVADIDIIFVREGQPFRPPASWAGHPWTGDTTPPPVVVVPPPVNPDPNPDPEPDPPVVNPPTGSVRRLPAHLRGMFGIHGEQWNTYKQQVAKLDATLAGRMFKYNFGTLSNNRALFSTKPTGWTTGDTLELMAAQWNTNQFGYKLQLPVEKVKYTGPGQPNTAHTPIPVEAWRSSHPKHAAAVSWLTTFGREIAELQRTGNLVAPFPITLMHENLGSYAFILGHTVNPKSAVEWNITGSALPHTPVDYAAFYRLAADTIRGQGADILAVYSPNAVREETKSLAEACVAAIGDDYLDVYGMSAYPHSDGIMASAEGYDQIGVRPTPFQKVASLEHQCQFIRGLTDAPLMVNEFGFNPTGHHFDNNGKRVDTDAAPVEHLIPDYFATAARFDIGQLWYFNADKIDGKEAFDILDDGNGTQHQPGTARILVDAARAWSDKVRV